LYVCVSAVRALATHLSFVSRLSVFSTPTFRFPSPLKVFYNAEPKYKCAEMTGKW
jgi:hypothetical protein